MQCENVCCESIRILEEFGIENPIPINIRYGSCTFIYLMGSGLATVYCIHIAHFVICKICVRLLSQTPYFIHENSITPYVASSRVFPVVKSLRERYETVKCHYCVAFWLPSILLGSSHRVRCSTFHPSGHVTYQSQQSISACMIHEFNVYLLGTCA